MIETKIEYETFLKEMKDKIMYTITYFYVPKHNPNNDLSSYYMEFETYPDRESDSMLHYYRFNGVEDVFPEIIDAASITLNNPQALVSAEYIDGEEVFCFSMDSDSSAYLFGNLIELFEKDYHNRFSSINTGAYQAVHDMYKAFRVKGKVQ